MGTRCESHRKEGLLSTPTNQKKTLHRPCIDRAGTDRAGSVHRVFIVQGPCRDRA